MIVIDGGSSYEHVPSAFFSAVAVAVAPTFVGCPHPKHQHRTRGSVLAGEQRCGRHTGLHAHKDIHLLVQGEAWQRFGCHRRATNGTCRSCAHGLVEVTERVGNSKGRSGLSNNPAMDLLLRLPVQPTRLHTHWGHTPRDRESHGQLAQTPDCCHTLHMQCAQARLRASTK